MQKTTDVVIIGAGVNGASLAAYEPHSGYADPTATTNSFLYAYSDRPQEHTEPPM